MTLIEISYRKQEKSEKGFGKFTDFLTHSPEETIKPNHIYTDTNKTVENDCDDEKREELQTLSSIFQREN